MPTRRRRNLIIPCLPYLAIAAFLQVGGAEGEPPIRLEHLGWTRDKHTKDHEFRVRLENRHERPAWFLFPAFVDERLPKDGLFRNHPRQEEQPFGGIRCEGEGGAVIQVEFFGRDPFNAFLLPAHSRIVFDGLYLTASEDFDDSAFTKLVALEAEFLEVNGTRPLQEWLPYQTMSGKNVAARRAGDFTNLDWDRAKRDSRDDYPKEHVRVVKASKLRPWTIEFRPRGEIEK